MQADILRLAGRARVEPRFGIGMVVSALLYVGLWFLMSGEANFVPESNKSLKSWCSEGMSDTILLSHTQELVDSSHTVLVTLK